MLFIGSFVPSALALTAETVELMWQTPLLGIGMVFAVLACLWAVLAIFKLVFAGATPKAPKPVKEKPVEQAPVQTAPVAAPATQSNDAELVAVITAAVAAYIAEEGTDAYSGGFRVVSFKRVRGGRTWNTK